MGISLWGFLMTGVISLLKSVWHLARFLGKYQSFITVTHTYNYAVFRKQDSGYAFSGLRSVHALPQQSLEVLVVTAKHFIEGLSIPATASISVSMWQVREPPRFAETMADAWQPSGDSSDNPPRDWERVQLTTENFGRDLFQCSRSSLFHVLPRTLVVVFSTLGSSQPDEIH